MARKVQASKADEAFLTVNGKAFSKADVEALLASRVGRGAGFYVDDADEYCLAKYTRILENGTTIVYAVKWNDAKNRPWIHSDINLRFNKGRPIPGFGGDEDFWTTLHKYQTSAEYRSDLKEVVAASRKIAAARKAKA